MKHHELSRARTPVYTYLMEGEEVGRTVIRDENSLFTVDWQIPSEKTRETVIDLTESRDELPRDQLHFASGAAPPAAGPGQPDPGPHERIEDRLPPTGRDSHAVHHDGRGSDRHGPEVYLLPHQERSPSRRTS
jgi:hypothetical protein